MTATATYYRANMLPGNDVGNATSETQLPNGRGAPLLLQLPSNGSLANKSFRVRAFGRIASDLTTTFNLNVYFGVSSTIASNTLIFSSGFQNIAATKSNFELWIDMTWDSDSKSINGRGAGQSGNHILGPTTLLNVPLSADTNRDSNTFLQSGPTYGFTITGQFTGSSVNNHAFCDEFTLELV